MYLNVRVNSSFFERRQQESEHSQPHTFKNLQICWYVPALLHYRPKFNILARFKFLTKILSAGGKR